MKAKLVIALMGFAAAVPGTTASTLCQRMATRAEQIPAAAWLANGCDPIERLVQAGTPHRSRRAMTPAERRLLDDPEWRQEFAADPGDPLDIERLYGTDVYRIDSFQGTASCQLMVFVEAPPGKRPRRLSAPFDAQPCTTQRGRFGHAFGVPLFMVGGSIDMDRHERSYRVSVWQGADKGWSPSCELSLEFDQRLSIAGSYCSTDAALCKAAAGLAPSIVWAYANDPSLDPLSFADRRMPPKALQDLLAGESDVPREWPAELPTFGAATPGTSNRFLTSFSTSKEPMRLAVWLDDRWWLGVVGVAGIGWRLSTTSLLAIYAVTEAGLEPVAGFQVLKQPVGPARGRWQ